MPDLPLTAVGRKAGICDEVSRARAERPPACRLCAAASWWNGWRIVFLVFGLNQVERREMALAKAKCSSCRTSFTVYPPGVYPRRQYQLDVVADSVARVVLGVETAAHAVSAASASATSARRWSAWIADLADPADLCAAITRVDPDAPAGSGISAVNLASRDLRAGRVLHALEQLGVALVQAGVEAARAVRTGLARVLHWQLAAHGDVVLLTTEPSRLSPAMALGRAEVSP